MSLDASEPRQVERSSYRCAPGMLMSNKTTSILVQHCMVSTMPRMATDFWVAHAPCLSTKA
ncbi:hypothetical protein SCLCIDRAFT_1222328 [Scleroderma citrinum Foug A]|uniref:Uncharacterized protein n=1 Tax=Scleroderma citrinum Foug A TaxID=1036808 RepID=A0A0C2ZN29_9AGAM|nr:hypothetical protein SCLCIDRAFT_1222328 [Scleroderma citrinum Foug A]